VSKTVGMFVNVRVEDHAAIKAAASDLGMTMADYIVERCLGRAALPRGPYAELERRVAALEAATSHNPPEEGSSLAAMSRFYGWPPNGHTGRMRLFSMASGEISEAYA
jgi:hypothetical protein